MFDPGQFWRKMLFWLRRKQLDRDLAEEMRDHLERKTAKNMAAGMPLEEARYAAQRQLGNFARQQEDSRLNWGFPLLESLAQDIRYGARGLRKAPGFTAVALLTLALGIGIATAIFSIVNAVLLRPLPYRNSSRLVHIWSVTSRFPEFRMGQSKPVFDEINAQSRSFETMALYQAQKISLTGQAEPEQVLAAAVSSNFLDLFSIQPALGRGFQPGDEELKNGNVVLLSHGLWQRRFAGDPGVVGRLITLDQKPYTVAGVLPQGFAYPENSEAWVPLVITGKDRVQRSNWMYMALGRLRPSITIRSAQTEMDHIAAQLAREYPKDEADIRFQVMSLHEGLVGGSTRSELATLAGAVTFLLLIGCANVSNLILSRGVQRRREIAVRAALGAGRKRILRQLLIESLLLAFSGGLAGLWLAGVGIGAFRAFAPPDFARLGEVHMEPAVALIAFIVSTLAGVLCGLAPALHTSRADLIGGLTERTAGSAGAPSRFSLRGFLAVSQVALALVLLTGSGLMAQSLARLMKVNTGFRTDHLLTAEIDTAKARYPSPEAQLLFLQHLLQTLRTEPQFSGVAISNNSMMTGNMALIAFDPEALGIKEKSVNLEAKSVSPGFFETMGIPVVAGRSFNDRDAKGAPQVVVINESVARHFFAGQDPLGKFLKFGPDPDDRFQIIGVTADTRDIHLSAKARLQVYFSLLQDPQASLHLMVRSTSDPIALAKLLQQRVWSVDKDQPLTKVSSMTQVIAQSVAEPRFRTWLLAAFAGVGLILTLIGVYGVVSYSVSQRTQEMGIRMALGARPENVLRLVLSQGVRLALLGASAGLAGSLLLMRLLTSQLYEIKPGDPVTLAGAAILMLVAALGASYVPARRATKVDPMVALRFE